MDKEFDIKAKVLEKIGHGKVRKRSRAYFAAQVIILILFFVVAAALSVFVLSFALFSIHESGEQFLLGFGGRGMLTFFALFPWMMFFVDAALFAAIEWLFRRFQFGYRIPVLRVLLGIVLFAALGGVVVYLTPLHATLLQRAQQEQLPFIGGWYGGIYASHKDQGVFRGTVSSIQGNTFVIFHDDNDHDGDDGTWTVAAPVGFDMTTLTMGERVYVAGAALRPGVIQAYGIQQLSGDM